MSYIATPSALRMTRIEWQQSYPGRILLPGYSGVKVLERGIPIFTGTVEFAIIEKPSNDTDLNDVIRFFNLLEDLSNFFILPLNSLFPLPDYTGERTFAAANGESLTIDTGGTPRLKVGDVLSVSGGDGSGYNSRQNVHPVFVTSFTTETTGQNRWIINVWPTIATGRPLGFSVGNLLLPYARIAARIARGSASPATSLRRGSIGPWVVSWEEFF